jgi:hypothetical protein
MLGAQSIQKLYLEAANIFSGVCDLGAGVQKVGTAGAGQTTFGWTK